MRVLTTGNFDLAVSDDREKGVILIPAGGGGFASRPPVLCNLRRKKTHVVWEL
ncbi:hypothetical protein ASPCADRAFT_204288, partial [Aspergillus carbonarius ITEM 5010]